ncbi:MinD/ParA family protein [Candidatus Igneacidithiobacillus taiwanensis]|uniref:MinD/ParA family protein n=1 Tax=Candidatus Igneacidithiobacillus taiwanensis TaxID=1945924 RepID=UPI002896BE86|nr:MinD/ParA family protein [Candidatus Igneacidithiobacillus taiwanensis]
MPMYQVPKDQAEGLRNRAGVGARILAVASGKGGVGKTNVAVNLSLALAMRGKRLLLLDADLGLGNVDVLLGLSPRYHLAHVLAGEKTLDEVLVSGPQGIQILPAASGIAEMANLDARRLAGLMDLLGTLEQSVDYLLIDLAAGIGTDVLRFAQAADHVLVVVTNDPASITDAYAFMKVMSRDYGVRYFSVLANMVRDEAEGKQLFSRLAAVAQRYLDIPLRHAGSIPLDPYLRSAIRSQQALIERYPNAVASQAFRALAETVLAWPQPQTRAGEPRLFASRLLGRGA